MSTEAPDSMRRYYALRAREYERVYAKPERQADIAAVKAWLPTWFDGCKVVEVACGTGYWTPVAAVRCASWMATDVNDEVLTLARVKPLPHPHIQFTHADAYALGFGRVFDAAFAGFWWSHVPIERGAEWLGGLHACLQAGARVVLIDNRYVEGSSSPITRRDEAGNSYQTRRLDDGSTFEVLKNFPSREDMQALIGPLGSEFAWTEWPYYWACTYRAI